MWHLELLHWHTNYSGDSVNWILPSAANGAHVKAPHLTILQVYKDMLNTCNKIIWYGYHTATHQFHPFSYRKDQYLGPVRLVWFRDTVVQMVQQINGCICLTHNALYKNVWNTLTYVTSNVKRGGKSDMEGVPPAPYGVTFAPHHVAVAPLFVSAQYMDSCFHWTVYNITYGDMHIVVYMLQWSEPTSENRTALNTPEVTCCKLWPQSEIEKCQQNV